MQKPIVSKKIVMLLREMHTHKKNCQKGLLTLLYTTGSVVILVIIDCSSVGCAFGGN